MTLMQELLVRPGGGPATSGSATVRLIASTTDPTAPGYSGTMTILGRWRESADATGLVSFELEPTSLITIPVGTVYEIVAQVPGSAPLAPRYFTTPNVAGPVWIKDFLTTLPGALPDSALGAHTSQTTTAHGGVQLTSAKGQPNGYAALDAAGVVPGTQLPAGGGAHPDLAAHDTLGLATQAELNAAAATLQLRSEKGQPSGYAELNAAGKLLDSVLPNLAINDTFDAASQAAMLALVAQRGDVAIRSDVTKNYILAADDPSVLANWRELAIPADVVTSVQGLTGIVVLPSDGAVGTASLRTLGTGAQQALPGNHASTSDQRTPLDGSVTTVKLGPNAVTAAKVAADVATQAELDTHAATPHGGSLSDAAPIALGTAAAGTGTAASRGDHVHPTTGLVTLTGDQTLTASKTMSPATAAQVPLVLKGLAAQSGNLTEWRDSANAIKLAISPTGTIRGVGGVVGGQTFFDGPVAINGAITVAGGSAILSDIFQSATTGFINMVGTLRGHEAAAGGLRIQAYAGQTDDLVNLRGSDAIQRWGVTPAGLPRFADAANAQTTAVGASPVKYFKVVDALGTVLVIPAYLAA